MITIEQLAEKVIELIRTMPDEARQSVGEDAPITSWDDYKEQVQFEESDLFEVFQYTIKSLVKAEVDELSDQDVVVLYLNLHKNYYPAELAEQRDAIYESIHSTILSKAESEEIEYNKPHLKYVEFNDDDNLEEYNDGDKVDSNAHSYIGLYTIAKVIEKKSPSEHLIHSFSSNTGPEGEEEIRDLNYLDQECALNEITYEKFEEIKKSFFSKPVGTTRESLPKRKRVSSLEKHIPEISKLMKELRKQKEDEREGAFNE